MLPSLPGIYPSLPSFVDRSRDPGTKTTVIYITIAEAMVNFNPLMKEGRNAMTRRMVNLAPNKTRERDEILETTFNFAKAREKNKNNARGNAK